jgi:hypothetical protein
MSCAEQNQLAWLYLPAHNPWTLASEAAVLVSDEVLPEDEDADDAGVPAVAQELGLTRVLPVTVLQEIVSNAATQLSQPGPHDLLRAFIHYYDTDAFIDFGP